MQKIIKNKINLVLVLVLLLIILGGFFIFQRLTSKPSSIQATEEVDLTFDPEGPYAMLFPRRDGNALILNMKRTASYDKITYELVYVSQLDAAQKGDMGEGFSGRVDRAAMGEINIKDKKGEYEQEILFGSCSTGGKCVFDKGVENGTLTLHIKKGNKAYRMVTQWHIQKPDLALGVLTSGDSHFTYKINPKSTELSLLQYTVINDLTGAPKLPSDKKIIGKVYVINSSVAKEVPKGIVTIELAEEIPSNSKIAHFLEKENRWIELETKIEDGELEANTSSGGIFAIFAPK